MNCSLLSCKDKATGRVLIPIKLTTASVNHMDFLTQGLCDAHQVEVCLAERRIVPGNVNMGRAFAVPLDYEDRMESARTCGRKLEEG
jgi:hypothetical protein